MKKNTIIVNDSIPPEIYEKMVKRNRDVKATYLRLCRKYIFDKDWSMVRKSLMYYAYDANSKRKLKSLHNRLHKNK